MKYLKTIAVLASVVGLLALLFPLQSPVWQKIYEKDLEAVCKTLQEDHPGFYDAENPEFKTWLVDGYQQALALSDKVDGFENYLYGLYFFVNGFKDNHLRIEADTSQLPSEWPGFSIGYQPGFRTGHEWATYSTVEEQDEAFVVTVSERESVPVGAQLISCDGINPRAWLEKYICPFVDSRNLDASWTQAARYLTWWRGSSFVAKPKVYGFSYKGKEWQEKPEWHNISVTEYHAQVDRKNAPTVASIKKVGPSCVWVALPSFYPQSDAEREALENVIDAIAAYKNFDIIIFDLRGNKGGNSFYGTRILRNVFGADCCQHSFNRMRKEQYVEWRASKGNITHLQELIEKLKQQPQQHELVVNLSELVKKLEKSLQSDQAFYRTESNSNSSTNESGKRCKGPRVALITDSYCASACLDFIDELYAVTPAFQIGLPTNADTMYLECRDVKLPSSLATLHLPIKVFRNRQRRSNDPWIPDEYIFDVYNNDVLARVVSEKCAVAITTSA